MKTMNLPSIIRNEPVYRLKEIKREVFINLIDDWQKASYLPKDLKELLSRDCSLETIGTILYSKDERTAKALLTLEDGLEIETVLMNHKDGRNTICVSSQVGCPLGCLFCATGRMGFKRDLTVDEIVSQVIFFARELKKSKEKVTNIVFMGMGEPFLNYNNVLAAINILHDPDGFNLGARHFSISTVGIPTGINKLAGQNLDINLAISLHAPNNELRSQLIPINKEYPLETIFKGVDEYLSKTKRRVMIEYLMLDGVNDSDECAHELAALMKKPLYLVNLILYNQTGDFRPSSTERVNQFKEILEKENVAVTQRYRFGDDITAACGQLAARHP